MIKYIQAEFIKLKFPPIWWLIGATVLSISILIYFAHYNDVESISAIGKNPWYKIWSSTIGIFSIFMKVPFLVLLLSAAIFIENHNNTWKYQYTAPVTRVSVIFTKLISIILLITLTYILLAVCIFMVAYSLNYIFPETEFSYYPIDFTTYSHKSFLTLINSLGIIGIQFFLCMRFKGFLVPAAIGIVAFIMALIVGITNTPVSQYFPYAYPLIGQDFEMFRIDNIGIVNFGWVNSVQVLSIITFIVFSILGILMEQRRAI